MRHLQRAAPCLRPPGAALLAGLCAIGRYPSDCWTPMELGQWPIPVGVPTGTVNSPTDMAIPARSCRSPNGLKQWPTVSHKPRFPSWTTPGRPRLTASCAMKWSGRAESRSASGTAPNRGWSDWPTGWTAPPTANGCSRCPWQILCEYPCQALPGPVVGEGILVQVARFSRDLWSRDT